MGFPDFSLLILRFLGHPFPSLPEQTAIAGNLDKATAAIDIARRQTELMQQYRASPIAHIVSGKLDIRAAFEQVGMETSQT